jgi:hypothetical protein
MAYPVTLESVLQDVAAFINQDPATPTGTDLGMWISLVDHAQNEWATTYQWKQLRRPFYPTSASGVSLALPATFKKLMSPVYDLSLTSNNQYQEINPSERYLHTSSPDDKYCWVLGNWVTGFSLQMNPPPVAGASLSVDIQFYPSGLVTLPDVVTCPSHEYLVHRTIASVLAARSDPRFTHMAQDADELLSNMVEEEAARSGSWKNQTPSQFSNMGFRIGE